jgi:GxxExxY protein
MDEIFKLCDVVRQTGFEIHQYLRNGHLEKIYENALVHRLRKKGVLVRQQHPMKVFDEDGTVLGNCTADLIIEDKLIVELKACSMILHEHSAQLIGYLRASRIEHGLLVNFGAAKFEIKKYVLTPDRF